MNVLDRIQRQQAAYTAQCEADYQSLVQAIAADEFTGDPEDVLRIAEAAGHTLDDLQSAVADWQQRAELLVTVAGRDEAFDQLRKIDEAIRDSEKALIAAQEKNRAVIAGLQRDRAPWAKQLAKADAAREKLLTLVTPEQEATKRGIMDRVYAAARVENRLRDELQNAQAELRHARHNESVRREAGNAESLAEAVAVREKIEKLVNELQPEAAAAKQKRLDREAELTEFKEGLLRR